jgi:predicted aspartyl protease
MRIRGCADLDVQRSCTVRVAFAAILPLAPCVESIEGNVRSRQLSVCANACSMLLMGASAVVRSQPSQDELSEIIVQTHEPRFVAPTRRDSIGRIWAPVLINGKGPFRLVLDTGASRSAINASVAQTLGLAPEPAQHVLLRGVTGNAIVPTVHVESFAVGDVILAPALLPIVADALGGAEGVLGTEGFDDKRIYIDFKHDSITIVHSRGERARLGFVSIPFDRSTSGLVSIHARVADVRVRAIFDTGGQSTIGNQAMREALVRRRARGVQAQVFDVTSAEQGGETFPSPTIELGSVDIENARITYGDMHIFEHWHLTKEPVLLIGMDVIGLLDTFIIDYRQKEVFIKMSSRPW